MTEKKRILITGANGFTGRYLVPFLSLGTSSELFLADHSAPSVPDPRFSVCDLSVAPEVTSLINTVRPHAIYHLVGSYTNEYDIDYASNVVTTRNILNAVRTANLQTRILLVGSSAEYGFPLSEDKAVTEEHPLLPVSIYGLMKVYQTTLMGVYVRLYGMDIVMVRPFNLYGKGISERLLSGKMEREIERYKQGKIQRMETGDLSIERDYIDINEAIKYYSVVLEKGKKGEIYNVGSGKSTPLRDRVSSMLTAEGLSLAIVKETAHSTPGKIAVRKIVADISKISSL